MKTITITTLKNIKLLGQQHQKRHTILAVRETPTINNDKACLLSRYSAHGDGLDTSIQSERDDEEAVKFVCRYSSRFVEYVRSQ